MKRIYGKIFKELRLNKGYSIKEISDAEVSTATISKFEHGTAMISVDKFFKLISNINVTPSEFSFYVEEARDIPYSFSSVTKNFAVLGEKKKNLVKVERTLNKLNAQYVKYPDRKFLRIQIISLQALISQALPDYREKIDPRSIEFIKHYLLNSKNWNDFELRIYCSTIHLFELPTVEELTNKLLNPLNYRLITPDIRWMMNGAIINLVDALLGTIEDDYENTTSYFYKILHYIEEHPIADQYVLEKIFLKFNIGLFHFRTGDRENAIKEMKEATLALLYSGCDDYANSLILEFERATGQMFFETPTD